MEIKVREVGGSEEKSRAQVEQELLDKAEKDNFGEENSNTEEAEINTESEPATEEQETLQPQEEIQAQSSELNEEDVLSYIKNRYDKQIDSVGQLFEERESNEELPEDVAAYFEYKKNTGRGISDYAKLQQDFDSMDEDTLLKNYLLTTEEGLDSEDVDVLMSDYKYDEDIDDESDIKKIKIAKKKAIGKAKRFFNEQKEKYHKPLESSTAKLSESDSKKIEEYAQYMQKATSFEEEQKRRRDWFVEKTNEVFSDFKGFDFKVGEKKFRYGVQNPEKLADKQSNITNLVGKFFDSEGKVKDSKGYHKAIYAAENVDTIANHFYEQGKADAIREVVDGSKNPSTNPRQTAQTDGFKDGIKVKVLGDKSNDSSRLSIKKIKI